MTTATAEELYRRLAPLAYDDEKHGFALLHLASSTGDLLHDVEVLARDTDTHVGWGTVLDPDAAPAYVLPWLAQWVGAELTPGMSEQQQRDLIKAAPAFKRGTPTYLRAAAQLYLTGTKRVDIYERVDGNAYRFLVVTYDAETPDEAAMLAAVRAAKPAGLVMEARSQAGPSIDQLVGTIDAQPPAIDDYESQVP